MSTDHARSRRLRRTLAIAATMALIAAPLPGQEPLFQPRAGD